MKYEPDQSNDYATAIAVVVVLWLIFAFGMYLHDEHAAARQEVSEPTKGE